MAVETAQSVFPRCSRFRRRRAARRPPHRRDDLRRLRERRRGRARAGRGRVGGRGEPRIGDGGRGVRPLRAPRGRDARRRAVGGLRRRRGERRAHVFRHERGRLGPCAGGAARARRGRAARLGEPSGGAGASHRRSGSRLARRAARCRRRCGIPRRRGRRLRRDGRGVGAAVPPRRDPVAAEPRGVQHRVRRGDYGADARPVRGTGDRNAVGEYRRARARHPRAVLGGAPYLRERVGRAAASDVQYEHAHRAGVVRRLSLQRGGRPLRRSVRRRRGLLRHIRRHHRAGAVRKNAGGAGQGQRVGSRARPHRHAAPNGARDAQRRRGGH